MGGQAYVGLSGPPPLFLDLWETFRSITSLNGLQRFFVRWPAVNSYVFQYIKRIVPLGDIWSDVNSSGFSAALRLRGRLLPTVSSQTECDRSAFSSDWH